MLHVLLRIYVLSARAIALLSVAVWILIWSSASAPVQYSARIVFGVLAGYLAVWVTRERILKEGIIISRYEGRRYILCARAPTMKLWKLYETGLLIMVAMTWLVFWLPGPAGGDMHYFGLGFVVISIAYPILDRALGLNRIPTVELTS